LKPPQAARAGATAETAMPTPATAPIRAFLSIDFVIVLSFFNEFSKVSRLKEPGRINTFSFVFGQRKVSSLHDCHV